MELLESVVSVVKALALGFVALIGGLFVVAILFGKRIEKKWEYEAKFRGPGDRELGEFDIQLSRVIEKDPAKQKDFAVDAKFVLGHPSLQVVTSVVAVTLAVRGSPVSSDISPNASPGPSRCP